MSAETYEADEVRLHISLEIKLRKYTCLQYITYIIFIPFSLFYDGSKRILKYIYLLPIITLQLNLECQFGPDHLFPLSIYNQRCI